MASNRILFALPLLAACTNLEAPGPTAPSAPAPHRAWGTTPASEVATWRRVSSTTTPESRYLQAAAFDKTRSLVVVFGGASLRPTLIGNGSVQTETNNDVWEWTPQTGKWAKREGTGPAPEPRTGAAMVYDSQRQKLVMFGGRGRNGTDLDDTWEWDPATAAWTALTTSGARPAGRCQHGLVYEESTKKILLFGGGQAKGAPDGTTVAASLGDTWELDPSAKTWTALAPATSPTTRHDFGMVWDGSRAMVVLFGGMQLDIAGAAGVPKQDVWDWDPSKAAWTERSAAGTKPGQRSGHAMAFDDSRKKVVVFGGLDMDTKGNKNDLWDWDPGAGTWSKRLAGTETGVPPARSYAAMVAAGTSSRLALFGGQTTVDNTSNFVVTGADEVWELDAAKPAFTNRTAAQDAPPGRADHAMAYNPATRKVYVFGGYQGPTNLDDFWEWNGTTWSEVVATPHPSARYFAAMAYDPVRQSLILYGGGTSTGLSDETWEWSGTTRAWTKLATTGSPGAISGASMAADTTRNRLLLFGGTADSSSATAAAPVLDRIWEWDGATLTWSERTAYTSSAMPHAEDRPVTGYDQQRQKLLLYSGRLLQGDVQGLPGFWEWDAVTRGWVARDTGGVMGDNWPWTFFGAYDTVRRRAILLLDQTQTADGGVQVLEHDPATGIFYKPAVATFPVLRFDAPMVFDSGRGVVVWFGGQAYAGNQTFFNDTWEYQVTGLGNGEGCTADSAATCASGHCVDGVCCESASCTGPCQSCNAPGAEGTCTRAPAGTEVAGSCADGQACDGTGSCKSKNGQACTAAGTCASGFCVDKVCCDSACRDRCMACNVATREGQCTPHPVGSDPDRECGDRSDACRATCNGAGACAYPWATSCGACAACNGDGSCITQDPCGSMGGRPGATTIISKYGTGGAIGTSGGAGGSVSKSGGAGGAASTSGGAGGAGLGGMAGSGGSSSQGGAGGAVGSKGGSVGSSAAAGRGGSGGAVASGGSSARGSGGASAGGASGGTADGGVKASIQRGGCSCRVDGEGGFGALPVALVVLGLLWRRRRSVRPTRATSARP